MNNAENGTGVGGSRRFPTVIREVAGSQSEADLHRKAQRYLEVADIAYTITIDIGEYDKGKSRTLQSLVAKLYCQDDVPDTLSFMESDGCHGPGSHILQLTKNKLLNGAEGVNLADVSGFLVDLFPLKSRRECEYLVCL